MVRIYVLDLLVFRNAFKNMPVAFPAECLPYIEYLLERELNVFA